MPAWIGTGPVAAGYFLPKHLAWDPEVKHPPVCEHPRAVKCPSLEVLPDGGKSNTIRVAKTVPGNTPLTRGGLPINQPNAAAVRVHPLPGAPK